MAKIDLEIDIPDSLLNAAKDLLRTTNTAFSQTNELKDSMSEDVSKFLTAIKEVIPTELSINFSHEKPSSRTEGN